jgi:hypothetical protein
MKSAFCFAHQPFPAVKIFAALLLFQSVLL